MHHGGGHRASGRNVFHECLAYVLQPLRGVRRCRSASACGSHRRGPAPRFGSLPRRCQKHRCKPGVAAGARPKRHQNGVPRRREGANISGFQNVLDRDLVSTDRPDGGRK
eukprot:6912607-Pyramimonas_sp.AAC.1